MKKTILSILIAFAALAAFSVFFKGDLKKEHLDNNISASAADIPASFEFLPGEYSAALRGYVNLLQKENPRSALIALRKDMNESPLILRNCHVLVHDIGHAAYSKYQNFGEAVKYLDEVCASGYFHGVVETYLSESSNISKTMKTTCTAYPIGKFMSWACYHGIGHALMYYTNNNLPRSLEYCEKYEKLFAQASCVNGVFMENFNTNQKEHLSEYLDPDDIMSPCREQAERHKSDCYLNTAVYYAGIHRGDYAGALAVCKNAEPGYQTSCASGAGGVAMQENMTNPKFVEEICMAGGSMLVARCIKGMVEIVIVNNASLKPAEELCVKLHETNRGACYEAISRYSSWF